MKMLFETSKSLRVKTIKHRSEEHTSELQSRPQLVCRLLPEKKTSSTMPSSRTSSPGTRTRVNLPAPLRSASALQDLHSFPTRRSSDLDSIQSTEEGGITGSVCQSSDINAIITSNVDEDVVRNFKVSKSQNNQTQIGRAHV